MTCFLYILAAYDPDEDRAYPAYACSDIRLDPDDAGDRDAILRLMAQGHGRPADSDYPEVVRAAYARLREEGGELDRHALEAALPGVPPDRILSALWGAPGAQGLPSAPWQDQERGPQPVARPVRATG